MTHYAGSSNHPGIINGTAQKRWNLPKPGGSIQNCLLRGPIRSEHDQMNGSRSAHRWVLFRREVIEIAKSSFLIVMNLHLINHDAYSSRSQSCLVFRCLPDPPHLLRCPHPRTFAQLPPAWLWLRMRGDHSVRRLFTRWKLRCLGQL